MSRYGKSRSSIYAEGVDGLFPKSFKLSKRSSGWIETETEAVIKARIAGKSEEEIKALVAQLEADRAA